MIRRLVQAVWRALILLLLAGLLIGPAYAAAHAQSDGRCRSLWTFERDPLEPFAPLNTWHERGFCGQGIRVGVINTSLPAQDAVVRNLEQEGLLVLAPDGSGSGSAAERRRALELIVTLHTIAPQAQLYVYALESADSFPDAWDWMVSNEINIVANLIASPLLDQTQAETIESLIEAAGAREVLWLNSAGNYGRSFVSARVDWTDSPRGEGWHRFPGDHGGLLPVRIVDPDEPMLAYLISDNLAAELLLTAYAEPALQTGLDLDETWTGEDQSRGYYQYELEPEPQAAEHPVFLGLQLTTYFRPEAQPVTFSLYLVNAVIDSPGIGGGNSIPRPNAYPASITVGALSTETWPLASSVSPAAGKPDIMTYPASLVEGSTEQGTGFATAIAAGLAATYWSQNAARPIDELRAMLLSTGERSMLRVASLGGGDGGREVNPVLVAAGLALAAGTGGGAWAFIRRRDRRQAIELLRNTDFRTELSHDCTALTVLFELPQRRNGSPYLLRFFRSLRIDIVFDPRLEQPPQFNSWLAHVNIVSTGMRESDGERDQPAAAEHLITCIHLSEREAILAIDLRYRHHIQYPVQLSFTDLVWRSGGGCPERVQLQLNISHNQEILCSKTLVGIPDERPASVPAQAVEMPRDVPMEQGAASSRTVFISYSSKDRAFVQDLLVQLRAVSGCEFWIDVERIPDGSAFWDREIQAGLDACHQMCLVLSPASMASDEVGREWNYYLLKRKPILALVYQQPETIHYRLSSGQLIFYDPAEVDSIVRRVAKALECGDDNP